jgi:hypothetical protein
LLFSVILFIYLATRQYRWLQPFQHHKLKRKIPGFEITHRKSGELHGNVKSAFFGFNFSLGGDSNPNLEISLTFFSEVG